MSVEPTPKGTYPGDVQTGAGEVLPDTQTPLHSPSKLRLPGRARSLDINRDDIVKEVVKWYDQDIKDRVDWSDQRIQRYAKLRGWNEPKDYPWPHASNAHIPMMMQDVLRTEDTLHNAVLAQRPVVSAVSLREPDKDKGENIDKLLDFQVFIENKGEEKIGELINSFVVDGTFVAFIPYIREDAMVTDVQTFPVPPPIEDPRKYLLDIIQQIHPNSLATQVRGDSLYTWLVELKDEQGKPQEFTIEFYLDDHRLLCESRGKRRTFDGPCIIPLQLEDLVVPPRSANLQPPGPSNPGGAHHVIMVDRPDLDEIKRLVKSGYYDLVTDEEMGALEATHSSKKGMALDPEAAKVQKDSLAGQTYGDGDSAKTTFTRYTCYCRWDIDGDGLEEDVIFWVIREAKLVLRARHLTEMYPSVPPRRPFAEARFIPVPERFYGIGLPELMEGIHDLLKVTFDQMVDNGTLTNTPWGTYRAASGVRPEVIRMFPGELYPTANPKEDVFFPQMPNANQTFGFNMATLLDQYMQKLTLVGELQLGRVPQGKASALRTVSGMQTVMQQGDARPERILRRFFHGLCDVWSHMHELNQAFLPEGKQFRVVGVPDMGKDPYARLEDPSKIRGRFQFDFKANVLNTNKGSQAQIMQTLLGTLINPMNFQLGIMTPEKVYTLLSDFVKANGQDPEKLLNAPTPFAGGLKITWEEALTEILNGQFPIGQPAEGPTEHLQRLQQFVQSDKLGLIKDEGSLKLLHAYMQSLVVMAQQMMAQQQLLAHSAKFQQQQGGGGGEGPAPQNPSAEKKPQLQKGEMLDETLPGAGGGGNAQPPGA